MGHYKVYGLEILRAQYNNVGFLHRLLLLKAKIQKLKAIHNSNNTTIETLSWLWLIIDSKLKI